MGIYRTLGFAAIATVMSAVSAMAELPKLNASVLKFGTVNWELDTIKSYGLDKANGFELVVHGVAGSAAAQVAFMGGETDVIVSDWLWVARQRAEGHDVTSFPYSKAVGGIMVPADSPAQSLSDLAGQKVGIAGGPLDKSWLILQAYARQQAGQDLKAETEQVYGAPPLIFKTAVDGDLGGAINFWHYMAKMKAAGMRELVSVSDAAEALGLDPDTPLLAYVLQGDLARENPDLVKGLMAASRQAKELLMTDDAAWERLRARMKPANEAEFEALVAGFRAGIPEAGAVDIKAASNMMDLMIKLGGEKLVGSVADMPDGVFLAL